MPGSFLGPPVPAPAPSLEDRHGLLLTRTWQLDSKNLSYADTRPPCRWQCSQGFPGCRRRACLFAGQIAPPHLSDPVQGADTPGRRAWRGVCWRLALSKGAMGGGGDAARRLAWREGGGQVGEEGAPREPLRSLRRGDSGGSAEQWTAQRPRPPGASVGAAPSPGEGLRPFPRRQVWAGVDAQRELGGERRDHLSRFPEANLTLTPRSPSHQASGKRSLSLLGSLPGLGQTCQGFV